MVVCSSVVVAVVSASSVPTPDPRPTVTRWSRPKGGIIMGNMDPHAPLRAANEVGVALFCGLEGK